MAKAASKSINEGDKILIATEILELTDKVNTLSSELKGVKGDLEVKVEALTEESLKIFYRDLGDLKSPATPEIYGNHEYLSGARVVNVNFKMKPGGFTVREISGHKAYELLPKVLGDEEYKKLFTETKVLEDDRGDLLIASTYRPDLVGLRLKGELPESEITALFSKYPDLFEPYVKDKDRYIAEVQKAKVAIEVTTSNGFIGNVAKLSDAIKFKVRDLLRKIFSEAVTTAVQTGNKAST
jgi:hypothetical protein